VTSHHLPVARQGFDPTAFALDKGDVIAQRANVRNPIKGQGVATKVKDDFIFSNLAELGDNLTFRQISFPQSNVQKQRVNIVLEILDDV
jgi:hypothetical protein